MKNEFFSRQEKDEIIEKAVARAVYGLYGGENYVTFNAKAVRAAAYAIEYAEELMQDKIKSKQREDARIIEACIALEEGYYGYMDDTDEFGLEEMIQLALEVADILKEEKQPEKAEKEPEKDEKEPKKAEKKESQAESKLFFPPEICFAFCCGKDEPKFIFDGKYLPTEIKLPMLNALKQECEDFDADKVYYTLQFVPYREIITASCGLKEQYAYITYSTAQEVSEINEFIDKMI